MSSEFEESDPTTELMRQANANIQEQMRLVAASEKRRSEEYSRMSKGTLASQVLKILDKTLPEQLPPEPIVLRSICWAAIRDALT